ncbi:hypothetical protein ACIQVU_02360 [Lysinibacillus sp. NPDC098008]|uniref:hypothetical protein n=1 Tax=Lysinibacillus sp. NPDC098008 TaxID=3364146 RepID=UPI0038145C2E
MGTSKGYLPPNGHLWSDTKRAVSGIKRNGLSSDSVGKALSKFSKATGGGYRTAGQSSVGTSGGKALNFAGLVNAGGLDYALGEIGLSHLKGRDAESILDGLIEYFCEGSNDLQVEIADGALKELMEELFSEVTSNEQLEQVYKDMEPNFFIKEYLIKYVEQYFFANFAEKINSLCDGLNQTLAMQERIKEYIRLEIEESYQNDNLEDMDWRGNQGQRYIYSKCNEVWSIFEMWGEN